MSTDKGGMIPDPQARLKALALEGARSLHCECAPMNEFLTENGVHVFTDDAATNYGFAVCPHPDCKLVRGEAVSVRSPEPLREDVVCEHGTAMDVHCCNCHSGFIFDMDHQCLPEEHDPLCSLGQQAGDQTMPCDCDGAPVRSQEPKK